MQWGLIILMLLCGSKFVKSFLVFKDLAKKNFIKVKHFHFMNMLTMYILNFIRKGSLYKFFFYMRVYVLQIKIQNYIKHANTVKKRVFCLLKMVYIIKIELLANVILISIIFDWLFNTKSKLSIKINRKLFHHHHVYNCWI